LSASDVARLEQENARLGVALDDSYAALARVQAQYEALKHELDWFKRQLFGQKSEMRSTSTRPSRSIPDGKISFPQR